MDSVEIRIFTLPLHFCILLLSEGDTTKSYNDKLSLFKYIQFISFSLLHLQPLKANLLLLSLRNDIHDLSFDDWE